MVANRSARDGAAFDDIEAWMERRKAQVGRFVRDAEVAGRQAWNDATRTGQNVLARTQSELTALSSQRLPPESSGAASSQGGGKPVIKSWLDQSPAAMTGGGGVAQLAGNVVGLGQGVWHSAEGIAQGLLFVSRLADPDDAELNGPDWRSRF